MTLKHNKSIKKPVVLLAVVAITAMIGVALSAQMGPRQGFGPGTGVGPGAPGMGPGGPGMGPGGRGMGMRGGPGGPMGPMGFGLRGLDLTDEQRTQVQALMESHRDEMQAAHRAVFEAREALFEAGAADTTDEAAIREKAAALGTAEGNAAVLQAKMRKAVLALLTPEQLKTLKDREAERENRRENLLKDRQERMKQGAAGRSRQDRSEPQTV